MRCNNSECRRSCGFTGESTFGFGLLDPYGYWQFPCRQCAAAFEARKEEIKEEIRQEMLKRRHFPLDVAQYLAHAEWLRLPAWPRADQDVDKLILDSADYFAKLMKEDAA